jgi:hypothetical protein
MTERTQKCLSDNRSEGGYRLPHRVAPPSSNPAHRRTSAAAHRRPETRRHRQWKVGPMTELVGSLLGDPEELGDFHESEGSSH